MEMLDVKKKKKNVKIRKVYAAGAAKPDIQPSGCV